MENNIKTFRDVMNYLNEIPYINMGGCGIAAYAMYQWLKNNDQLKEGDCIVYMYRDYNIEQFHENRNNIFYNHGNYHSCNHAGIRHGDIIFDSEGVVDVREFPYILEIPTLKFLINTLNVRGWNPNFKRYRHCPEIKKDLNVTLRGVRYNKDKNFIKISGLKNILNTIEEQSPIFG